MLVVTEASDIDTLSSVFSALSDPTRRAMLARLAQGDASVNELAAPFKMSLPAVSKHIKVLEKAGLLTKTINAQQRPCKIDGAQLNQVMTWLADYATNNIAIQAINTPPTAKISSKKSVKTEKSPNERKKQTKPAISHKEQKDDLDHDIQQQIGFDF